MAETVVIRAVAHPTGRMRAVFSRIWSFSGLKLETPMLLTKPLSTSDSMTAQISLKGGTTCGPASSEDGLHGQSNMLTASTG
ncbi:MAG: hypothetical protein FRX49_11530 [Trebouxia sp. A1-2]|nr:MAG: hypothetical protein FRX49_11530 [Trebouxia sp. A1-2]